MSSGNTSDSNSDNCGVSETSPEPSPDSESREPLNGGFAFVPSEEKLAKASAILTAAGVRLMNIEGKMEIGIWSDTDSAILRDLLTAQAHGPRPAAARRCLSPLAVR